LLQTKFLKKLYFIIILATTLAFSQQEASVWYFGQNAGLKFNTDGSVTPLANGQLVTDEGCSTISDSNGNLLMYTDGRTVWDRNHIQMPNGSYANGTELFGDASSTQSGIIIPKPGSSDIYYVFTVDEPHHKNAAVYPAAFTGSYGDPDSGQTPQNDDGRNNGLNYSVVDLNVTGTNGSVGDVVSRNNHLVTYDTDPLGEEIKFKCSEKITAVKNEADGSFWIIVHFINRFYAYKLTSAGVAAAPVVSVLGSSQLLAGYRRNAIGCFKASPDGTRLAIAHQQLGNVLGDSSYGTGSVELFDFSLASGQVTNSIAAIPGVQAYGVEFSPDSKKLYATYRVGMTPTMELAQLDLLSPNIPASKTVIYGLVNYLFALQLAPNNKIYCATGYMNSLGVINNPDAAGSACNYVQAGQPLAANTFVRLGLPPFVTSFLDVSFTVENLCYGTPAQFTLNSQNLSSVSWDFGDGITLFGVSNPAHQYSAPGNYTVTVTATASSGTVTKSKNIVISETPVASASVSNQSVCGTQGINYDLTPYTGVLLGSQSPSLVGVAYFSGLQDALTHANMLPGSKSLTLGANVFYAKVYSLANPSCHTIISFTVTLFGSPSANIAPPQVVCDDISNDGIAVFDLSQSTPYVLGLQDASQFHVSYYATQSDADSRQNQVPLSWPNQANPQTLYARIENSLNTSCFATTSFQLEVFSMPVANQPTDMYACASGNSQQESFDLSGQTPAILGSQAATTFTVSYHIAPSDALSGANPLNSGFTNTANPHQIFARIQNSAHPQCFDTVSFMLYVMPPLAVDLHDTYSICQGQSITVQAPLGFDGYQWSDGSSGSSLLVSSPGVYSLEVFKDYGQIVCNANKSFTVSQSGIASITGIEINDWTDSQNSIIVTAVGDGDYEYSVDGQPYQESNVFYGLASGSHQVYVHDKKECGTASEEVFLLMYPKFFTPNGDGINDVWQIKFSVAEPSMELCIFDRYGKLIKRFEGSDFGWDGTFNGKALFSDDYWFLVRRESGKEYKGHFSLKR
jgi:gliding motility-associated-like protein